MIAGTPFRCAANHLTWLSKDLQMRCDGKVLRNDHEIFNGNLSLQQFWHVFANQINILKPCWAPQFSFFFQFSLFLHPDQAQNTLSGIQGQEATAVIVIYVTAPTLAIYWALSPRNHVFTNNWSNKPLPLISILSVSERPQTQTLLAWKRICNTGTTTGFELIKRHSRQIWARIRTGSDWESFCSLNVVILSVSRMSLWSDFPDLIRFWNARKSNEASFLVPRSGFTL